MIWLKAIPYIVAGAGCVAAYVMWSLAKKRKAQIDLLSGKLANLSRNLQVMKQVSVADAKSQATIEVINKKIKEAGSGEEADNIRADFVDAVFCGLQDYYRK